MHRCPSSSFPHSARPRRRRVAVTSSCSAPLHSPARRGIYNYLSLATLADKTSASCSERWTRSAEFYLRGLPKEPGKRAPLDGHGDMFRPRTQGPILSGMTRREIRPRSPHELRSKAVASFGIIQQVPPTSRAKPACCAAPVHHEEYPSNATRTAWTRASTCRRGLPQNLPLSQVLAVETPAPWGLAVQEFMV